jgi:hypothetical protein
VESVDIALVTQSRLPLPEPEDPIRIRLPGPLPISELSNRGSERGARVSHQDRENGGEVAAIGDFKAMLIIILALFIIGLISLLVFIMFMLTII